MSTNSVERKFTEILPVTDWQVLTDTGWQNVTYSNKTVPYFRWQLKLDTGQELWCADTHVVFDAQGQEVFVRDLVPGDQIKTDQGTGQITQITSTDVTENMFDLTVDSADHRYYTGGILSHNTTCAAGYLLWYAMFVPDSTILVAAHKYTGAQEIMQRIRYAYEMCPDHIRAGAVSYNKGSIEFDNGSRIVSQTTTETTGRGMSISLLFCLSGDTTITIRDKSTGEISEISLEGLANSLSSDK